MSRSQVVLGRRVVCDKNIYYTITFSFVYPATVLKKFRRGCILKSNTSHVETNCIIQDHQISDSSQIFAGCWFRCTCLFQAAHVMLMRETSATYALSQDLCVWGIPCSLAPFCSNNIIISFKHLCNIIMCVCCFVLSKRYLGIVMYGPVASSWASQGSRELTCCTTTHADVKCYLRRIRKGVMQTKPFLNTQRTTLIEVLTTVLERSDKL